MSGIDVKDAKIAVRTTEAVKDNLRTLADVLSAELGTKITQSQAVEIAIAEALAKRRL